MRNKISLAKAAVAMCCSFLMTMGVAMATPQQPGASLNFSNGGTLTGYFNFDPVALQVDSWSLTSTAFGTHTYVSGNTAAGASSIVLSNSNNDEVISFFQVFQDGSVFSTF